MTDPSLEAIKGKGQYLLGDHNPTTLEQYTQPQPTETWELVPLTTVCNPYYELSASNMSSSSQLDIGTFRPN
jgi:hypothetical protein